MGVWKLWRGLGAAKAVGGASGAVEGLRASLLSGDFVSLVHSWPNDDGLQKINPANDGVGEKFVVTGLLDDQGKQADARQERSDDGNGSPSRLKDTQSVTCHDMEIE